MSDHAHIQALLSDLDSDSGSVRNRAEKALVQIGENAVEVILMSAHEINLQLLSGYQADSFLQSLERRIRLLGLIGTSRGLQMIAAAIADSSELIHIQHQKIQQMKSALIPDATYIYVAGKRLSLARRVHRTAVKALMKLGDEAEHKIRGNMNAFSPVAQKSMQEALDSVRFRRFWKGLLQRWGKGRSTMQH